MKNIVFILLFMIALAVYAFADTSPAKRSLLVSETVATVSTTAKLVSIPSNGYVEIFTQGKIYISLSGVTPNTSSRYLNAGNSLDTEVFRYTNQKLGVLADSGTVTYNITIYNYMGE